MKNEVINQVHCQYKEIDVNISFLPSCPRTDKLEVVRLICEQLSCLRKNTSSWLVYQSVSLRLTEFDLLLDIHNSAVSAIRLIEFELKVWYLYVSWRTIRWHFVWCFLLLDSLALFVFWLALRARQNTTQLVQIFSDTTHQTIKWNMNIYIPIVFLRCTRWKQICAVIPSNAISHVCKLAA